MIVGEIEEKALGADHEIAQGSGIIPPSTKNVDIEQPVEIHSTGSRTRTLGDGTPHHNLKEGVHCPVESPDCHSSSNSTHALTLREDENFYPEGGLQAWLVVFGSLCSLLACLGIMNTLGSFQSYISRNQLADYTQGQIGWIFSVYSFLSLGLGVIVGPIFDKFGPSILMITGSVAIMAGLMIFSVCTGM